MIPLSHPQTKVLLSVCTYRRNDGLGKLLESFLANERSLPAGTSLGAVVVDDSPDQQAEPVAREFADRFPLGVAYVAAGTQNISRARNMGLDAASPLADWVVMTDDDCEVAPDWVARLLAMQESTGADVVTGPLKCVTPPDAPPWITAQPFLEFDYPAHGDPAPIAATHNALISARWIRAHPEIRFLDRLGTTGGEDAVFYRHARNAGMQIVFAADAVVEELTPIERTTYRYQLWRFYWHGNSSYATAILGGLATPNRMFLAGGNAVRRAIIRPFARLRHREPPEWRFALASLLHGLGTMVGRFGVRVRHH